MRDDGLDEAIRVAGGVGALARKIGISQPSVSNWARIPAERVLSVEAATGVSRTILRPDLYVDDQGAGGDVDDVDAARAQEYALLSALLVRAPDRALLERLAALRGDASPLGLAHAALAEAARMQPHRHEGIERDPGGEVGGDAPSDERAQLGGTGTGGVVHDHEHAQRRQLVA